MKNYERTKEVAQQLGWQVCEYDELGVVDFVFHTKAQSYVITTSKEEAYEKIESKFTKFDFDRQAKDILFHEALDHIDLCDILNSATEIQNALTILHTEINK